ncbi:hypothetical protein CPC08DRAFT_794247 [Agrocybe pediades]|nr:hypothetical protein CPC08DRAFT_794247 [Agrocybe pediades]
MVSTCRITGTCHQSGPLHRVAYASALTRSSLLTSAKRVVDPTLHSGQGHSLAVCRALEPWLAEDADCPITFIQVPSKLKWKIHQEAHNECRAFNAPAVQHPSTSLDSVWRAVTKSVQEDWKMLFRDPAYRGHNFLMLQRPDEAVLEPSYINGGTWLSAAGGDLHLAVRICRCIFNHTPIGAYYECFNIPERTSCTCEDHPLKARDHILRHCGQYQCEEDRPPPRYYLGLARSQAVQQLAERVGTPLEMSGRAVLPLPYCNLPGQTESLEELWCLTQALPLQKTELLSGVPDWVDALPSVLSIAARHFSLIHQHSGCVGGLLSWRVLHPPALDVV